MVHFSRASKRGVLLWGSLCHHVKRGGQPASSHLCSTTARALTDEVKQGGDARNAERVRELQKSFADGTLNTPERVARAAERLLSGE